MLPVESGDDRRTRLLLAGFQRDRSYALGTGDPLPESLHRTRRTLHPHRLGDKDEENGVTPLLWVAGDQIAVIDDANPNTVHQYILDPAAAGQSEGTFTVSEGDGVQGAASITAYYPYSFYSASQGLSIPATQQHKKGRTMETDMLPMYAHSSGAQVGELDFHPVAGLINLQLTKNDKLNESRLFYSVKLVSTQDNLAGKGSLSDDSEGYKILTIDGDDASKEITFSLSESGLALKEGEITSLMFVVPAKTYSASTLKFVLTYKNSPDECRLPDHRPARSLGGRGTARTYRQFCGNRCRPVDFKHRS